MAVETANRQEEHASALKSLRAEAEVLLQVGGVDRVRGGIIAGILHFTSRTFGFPSEEATTRRVLDITLPPEEDDPNVPTLVYIETTRGRSSSTASRIDIMIGHERMGRGISTEEIVLPPSGRYLGVDKKGNGTMRYIGPFGDSNLGSSYVPLEEVRSYQATLGQVRERLLQDNSSLI